MNLNLDHLVLLPSIIKTRLFRMMFRDKGEEYTLRKRIRKRLKRLGRFYYDGNSDIIGYTYHPVPFKDFESVPSHRSECWRRLNCILEEVSIENGDLVLDIGANIGFYSFALAQRGAVVEAYESESDTFEIGSALAKLYNLDVLFINKSISVRNLKFLRSHYKLVLLLSIFHWLVKQEGEHKATHLLRDLSRRADYIFFETPCDSNDAQYKHPLFTSVESVRSYLSKALPELECIPIETDQGWMNRVLWKIDCRQANAK